MASLAYAVSVAIVLVLGTAMAIARDRFPRRTRRCLALALYAIAAITTVAVVKRAMAREALAVSCNQRYVYTQQMVLVLTAGVTFLTLAPARTGRKHTRLLGYAGIGAWLLVLNLTNAGDFRITSRKEGEEVRRFMRDLQSATARAGMPPTAELVLDRSWPIRVRCRLLGAETGGLPDVARPRAPADAARPRS
jgi:hypothetical protein